MPPSKQPKSSPESEAIAWIREQVGSSTVPGATDSSSSSSGSTDRPASTSPGPVPRSRYQYDLYSEERQSIASSGSVGYIKVGAVLEALVPDEGVVSIKHLDTLRRSRSVTLNRVLGHIRWWLRRYKRSEAYRVSLTDNRVVYLVITPLEMP